MPDINTVIPYPAMLARGFESYTFGTTFDLYGGSSDIVSDQGQAGGVAIPQFAVIGRNAAGLLVSLAAGYATGAVTFAANPTANDTVTIGGTVITFVAGAPAAGQVQIGANAAATAAALATYINANKATLKVEATSAAAVTTISATERGLNGNAITLAENGTNTSVSAATLAGGDPDAKPEAKAIGIAAQPIPANKWGPYFSGGTFNVDALGWPAGVDTIGEKKALFDGSNIGVRKLL